MTHDAVTVLGSGPGPVLALGSCLPPRAFNNRDNHMSPCEAYQELLETSTGDILIYLHDDVIIYDPYWLVKFLHCFGCYPNCVAVGLGGATALANSNLYKYPYNISNMARRGYASNQHDAEVHGERFEWCRQVAVLDAFCMAIRRDFLESVGGWPTQHLTHHCLDLWLACEAARANKSIYMWGSECYHAGGTTSTKKEYAEASWLQGGTSELDHLLPHKWLYNEYRDVLPIEV